MTVSVAGASPSDPYEIDLFSNPTDRARGPGLFGFCNVTGDPEVVVLNTEVANGHYITATATTTVGPIETSEFSNTTHVIGPVSVNTAPLLDPTISIALNPSAKDARPPAGAIGTLISDLVDLQGGGGNNNVTDPDPGAVNRHRGHLGRHEQRNLVLLDR